MPKNLINAGDSVVFAQHYLDMDVFKKLLGKTGVVQTIAGEVAIVKFDDTMLDIEVHAEDLELMQSSDLESTGSAELEDPTEEPEDTDSDEDLDNCSHAELITKKLSAQETDPELDKRISNLLTKYN